MKSWTLYYHSLTPEDFSYQIVAFSQVEKKFIYIGAWRLKDRIVGPDETFVAKEWSDRQQLN
jgi:hypothetical protein